MSEDVLKVIISDMPMLNTVPADDWCFDDHNIEYVDVSGWPLAKKTTKVVTTLDNPNIHKPIRKHKFSFAMNMISHNRYWSMFSLKSLFKPSLGRGIP